MLVAAGCALGWHLVAEGCGFAAFELRDVLGALPVLPSPPGAGLADEVPVPPSAVRVALPSVPAAIRCDPLPPPPVLAWMMAFRNGRTPSVTLAMTATAAKTAASRNDQPPHLGKLPCRNRGHRTSASRVSHLGRAQCPRHVQFRTRSAAPKRTLSSQGRGGRSAIRARILSSPSVPGLTSLAASDSARRSASSRSSSSGEVMPSPHLLAIWAIMTPPRST